MLARSESQKQYRLWEGRPNELWHWKFKLLSAEMLLFNGQTRDAQRLIASPSPKKFSFLEPRCEMLQAYARFRMNQHAEARALLDDAIKSAHAQSDFETEADSRLLLTAFASTDSTRNIERLFDDTLTFTRSHRLPYQEAAVLLNRGLLRIHQARFAAAVASLEEAEPLAKQANATLLQSMIIGNLATCNRELGEYEKSVELRNQAIAVQERAGLKTPLRDSYLELGSAELLKGKTAEAVQDMRRALSLTDERDAPGVYALIAQNLASALASAGQLDEAQGLNDRAKALLKPGDVEGRLWVLSTEAAIAEGRGNSARALELYTTILRQSQRYPSLTWSAEASWARILSARHDKAALAHYEAALRAIESSRAEQLESRYQVPFLSRLIRFYQDYVRFLVDEGDRDRALLVADSSRASVLTNTITGVHTRSNSRLVGRIQAGLRRTRSAVLFYFLAPEESYLWAITDHDVRCISLPAEDEIAASVRAYEQVIEAEKRDPLRDAAALPSRLFEMLVAPLLPSISGLRTLVIIPDGVLHHLNFETLVVKSPTPHYWIEDVTVASAPSLSLLSSSSLPAPVSRSMLLIGDPLSSAPAYPRLPFADIELQQVQAHFQQATLLEGATAVPSAYHAIKPERFSFIHVAAHAEANERSPLDSAIILSPERDGYRLYARDIMQTPLRTDLVVLSACRSAGSHTYSGEGPVGFVWAFLQSGARNVAASLWDVNDRSTASLMDGFYAALGDGQHYAEALRSAKLKAMRSNPKPYYWAPFQLYVRSLPD